MNDLTLLHLSDLHIEGTERNYSRLLDSLLSDIQEQVKYIRDKSLIVVVTGDIIHQGPLYSESKQAVENALKFFQKLHKYLGQKVVGIYIVPGNHDKYRTKEDKFLVPAYRAMEREYKGPDTASGKATDFGQNFYSKFWPYHLDAYGVNHGSGYLYMLKKIYNMFGLTDEQLVQRSYSQETFGVDVIDVLGKKYCFILLNTSWSCLDDSDNRNLILGQFQINKLKSQFMELLENLPDSKRPDITFVLGHHPLEALTGREEDSIFREIISYEGFDANIYLCGHTHDRTVNNWINNRHSLTTLVTGFGWPLSSGNQRIRDHYYSIYVFNLNANSIDVYVRSTDDSGNFQPDFRIYTNDHHDENKLVFPIHAQDTHTYLPLQVGGNRSPKAFYISRQFMEYMCQYARKAQWLCIEAERIIEDNRNQVFEQLGPNNDDDDDELGYSLYNYLFANLARTDTQIPSDVTTLFADNQPFLYQLFLGFLSELCRRMQVTFLGDSLQSGDIVRFHFRYLSDKNTLQYHSLCKSLPDTIGDDQYTVSPIKYGELIEKAYESGYSLIYTVNEEFISNKLKEYWKNFITVVPLFETNSYSKKNGNITKRYPYITFGVTTNSEKFDPLLYCMDYLSIKNLLEDLIGQYTQFFAISMDDFCKWAKKNLERGD